MKVTTMLAALALTSSSLFAGMVTPGSQVCVDITATDEEPNEQPTVQATTSARYCTDVQEDGSFEFSQFEIQLGNDFIDNISFGGQVDPMLGYAIAVADFGAPSSFMFAFSVPVAGGPYNTATHTMSASLTDGGDGSISFVPTGIATDIAFASVDATNLGIDLGGLGCVGGAGSSTCGPFSESTMFGPSSPATMSIGVAFTGSGAGDLYGVTGSLLIDATAIPEPATTALIGLGLVGLAAIRRKR